MKKILEAKVEYNVFPNKGICKIDDNLYSIKNTPLLKLLKVAL